MFYVEWLQKSDVNLFTFAAKCSDFLNKGYFLLFTSFGPHHSTYAFMMPSSILMCVFFYSHSIPNDISWQRDIIVSSFW
jgi:hypothetical protein